MPKPNFRLQAHRALRTPSLPAPRFGPRKPATKLVAAVPASPAATDLTAIKTSKISDTQH